jgi:hypothetical protein
MQLLSVALGGLYPGITTSSFFLLFLPDSCALFSYLPRGIDSSFLRSFASDATGQLNVLGHDGHPLGVNGAQIGVFKQSHQIGFGRFL